MENHVVGTQADALAVVVALELVEAVEVVAIGTSVGEQLADSLRVVEQAAGESHVAQP